MLSVQDTLIDPVSGDEVLPTSHETNIPVDPTAAIPVDPTAAVPKPTHKLDITAADLYTVHSKCQWVNLAVVYNYIEEIDESRFSEIKLSEISITYTTLEKILFTGIKKCFSPFVLGIIWKGIKNFNLAALVLEKYEAQTGIDRDLINPVKKVLLHRACAFADLTTILRKSVGLTSDEFLGALGSVESVRADGNICANIMINLYFPSVDVGLRFVLRFAVSDVPKNLIGKFSSDEHLKFDFSCDDSEAETRAEIVFKD